MPKQTKFNQNWLNKKDSNGCLANTWLREGDEVSTFKCMFCKTGNLDCSNQGWGAILQHMKTKCHREQIKLLKDNTKLSIDSLKMSSTSTSNASSTPELKLACSNQITTLDFKEQVTKAEALWTLAVSQRGYSFNSCEDIGSVFREMFPDSKIAQEFSMQSRKISYVLSHGLGPYFHQELVKSLKRCEKFVLCFDEQTNNQNRKQLDLMIKYWCYNEGLVVTRYYKTILLGHATAAILKTSILDAFKTDGLELRRLLMLGRDSPFVNLSLENMIDNEMKTSGSFILKLGGCHLHMVHNGFKAGLSSTNWNVQNKCIDIYSWFKQSPARKQDLMDIVDDYNSLMEKTILYFTNTRWVLLGKVIGRVLTLWEPLHEYFLIYLPGSRKTEIQNNDRYVRIRETLTSHVIKIRMHFVLFLCETIFDRFLTLFQQEAPLIHLLYHELSVLYRSVLLQFLASDYVGDKTGGNLFDIDFRLNEKQLNNKQMRIGEGARKLLNNLSQNERECFYQDVRKVYYSTAEYLKKNLPLKNSFLRDMQILHPSYRSVQYADDIVRIARSVPCLLTDQEVNQSRDEWLNYSLDNIEEAWYIKEVKKGDSNGESISYHRIDSYWNKVLNMKTTDGRLKYPCLHKLIKNILIIPHGNADLERGFSINENIVPENRSKLSEVSINGLRSAYDAVKFVGHGSSHKVPINKAIIKAVQNSHLLYKNDLRSRQLAAEKAEQENSEQYRKMEVSKQEINDEDDLLTKQKNLQLELCQTTSIISDASHRLQTAIKNKNSLDIDKSTILIEGCNSKAKAINEQLGEVTSKLIEIQAKRRLSFNQQQQKRQKTLTDTTAILK